MQIAVRLKQVPAKNTPLHLDWNGCAINDERTVFDMNEADAYALEAALALKDEHGADVVAVSLGPERIDKLLREALAKGADRAVHLFEEGRRLLDPFEIALCLSPAVAECDLVLTGLQSDDWAGGQTGVILAELLNRPHASIALGLRVEGPTLRVTRETGGGTVQDVEMELPAVVSIQSGCNKPRYSNMRGMMQARRASIERVATEAASEPEGRPILCSLHMPAASKRTQLLEGDARTMAGDLAAILDRICRD
jgi:electron transfer flavoprotein beta subunit